MLDADFHQTIARIQRRHWLHFPGQALVMLGLVLLLGQRVGLSDANYPSRVATGPVLVLLGALVPVVSALLYVIARRLRPNLRRRAEENLRIYQGRVFLRNSLLGLLGLPFLVSYFLTRGVLELVACGFLLGVLSWLTAPSAKDYQRWLLR